MHFLRLARLGGGRIKTSLCEHIFRRVGWDFTRPTFVRCVLTERCNYKCLYCSHWRQDSYTEEMPLDEWKKAIVSLHQFVHPLVIQFVGGEPFMWPQFPELVKFCHSIDVNWGVITNGSALTNEKIVRKIISAQPLNIDISVDGSTSEIHDKARGIEGSLDRIERGLRLLVSERNKSGQRFPIRIKPTVHRLNAGNLSEIVSWSKKHGATSVDFSPIRLWREKDIKNLWVSGPRQTSALRHQVKKILEMKEGGLPIETSIDKLEGLETHFAGAELQHGAVNCRSALRDFFIYPNGNVKVCGCFPVVGNLRQQSARSIWNGESAKKARLMSLNCKIYTSTASATSCTTHRSLWQDVRRATMLFGKQIWRLH